MNYTKYLLKQEFVRNNEHQTILELIKLDEMKQVVGRIHDTEVGSSLDMVLFDLKIILGDDE